MGKVEWRNNFFVTHIFQSNLVKYFITCYLILNIIFYRQYPAKGGQPNTRAGLGPQHVCSMYAACMQQGCTRGLPHMGKGPAWILRWKIRCVCLVSAAGFEPTAPGFIPLQLSLPLRCRSVCGLDCPFAVDLCLQVFRHRPSSLYTFRSCGTAWLGIGKTLAGRSVPRL